MKDPYDRVTYDIFQQNAVTTKERCMTDYEIFKWLYAHVTFIERIRDGFAMTYKDCNDKEQIILGMDIKDCVRKACTIS